MYSTSSLRAWRLTSLDFKSLRGSLKSNIVEHCWSFSRNSFSRSFGAASFKLASLTSSLFCAAAKLVELFVLLLLLLLALWLVVFEEEFLLSDDDDVLDDLVEVVFWTDVACKFEFVCDVVVDAVDAVLFVDDDDDDDDAVVGLNWVEFEELVVFWIWFISCCCCCWWCCCCCCDCVIVWLPFDWFTWLLLVFDKVLAALTLPDDRWLNNPDWFADLLLLLLLLNFT